MAASYSALCTDSLPVTFSIPFRPYVCRMICNRSLTLGTTSHSESIDVDHTRMSSSLIAQANELDSF